MPFYVNDFYSHPEVKMMDFWERSLYLAILHACWESTDDTIPDDAVRLARWVGIGLDDFNNLWPTVRDRFVEAREGRLTHPRIAREKEKYRARAEKNSKNSRKRWEGKDNE